MATITVKNAAGVDTPVELPLTPGQATMALSRPVVIASNQSAVPVSGTFWQATQPVSLASVPSHPVTNAGTFAVQATQAGTWNVTNISGTISLPTGAATSANQSTAIGHLATIATAAADTTTPSPVRIDQTTDGTTNRVSAMPAGTAYALLPAPSTARLLSAAASINATLVKNGAGALKGLYGYNAKASAVYLKLYNKGSGVPVVASDVPFLTLYLPATNAFAFDFPTGLAFTNGLGFVFTTAAADTTSTALVAADILGFNVAYH